MSDKLAEYHGKEPWSFGGKQRVALSGKVGNRREIDNLLAQSDIYTRFKRHRKSRKYSPIYVYKRRELFQSDVVFFTNKEFIKANGGYKYLFTTIDVFTKMAWVYPLKANTCENIKECFKDILEKCGEPPQRLNTDRGSELICKSFESYLTENKIHHYLSYSIRKCPVVERFNLTIQQLLYRLMAYNHTYEWVKYLDDAMHIYLNRKHSAIKMAPIEADKKINEEYVRSQFLIKYNKAKEKKVKPKYKLGDTVRIWKEKGTFDRGYAEQFTREHFTISEVKTNLPVPRYALKDAGGESVIGNFFEDELVLYKPNEFYDIEVINERKRGKKTEYLVHYIGYPSSMDQWIMSDQIKSL